MKINIITQAAIKINSGDKVIYFDPYNIVDESHDADYIFITHDHYDHYDEKSIEKIKKDTTKIIVPLCLKDKEHSLLIEGYRYYGIDDLEFYTIPSYNINKQFHPREKYYIGYLLELEADGVKCDICFVPIGGTYTMDVDEAVSFINDLKPEVAIPIHYGSIVGDKSLGEEFKNKVDKNIKVEIYI